MERKDAKMAHPDFGAEISRILPRFMREFARSQKGFFARFALSVPQLVIIELLEGRGQCKMKELARALNLTMSAVTAIVDKMIRLKLVKRERSSEDRRVVYVTILQKGRDAARGVREGRLKLINRLFSTLTEKEKNEYLRILGKVYHNLIQKK